MAGAPSSSDESGVGRIGQHLEAVVAAIPAPFFVIDEDGRYVAALGGRDHTNYHDGRRLVGCLLHEVMASDIADIALEKIRQVINTDEPLAYRYELGSDDVDGVDDRPGVPTRLRFEGHITPIAEPIDGLRAVVFMPFNITELQLALDELEQQRAELDQLANTDFLTEIRNRRSFLEAAEHELAACRRSGRPATLVLVDLDHFKVVNDTGGHAAGDAVLAEVAQLLRADRRESDVVARLGGEEFAVLLTDTVLDAATAVAERLRASISALAVEFEGCTYGLTTSLGVTPLAPGDTIGAALSRADGALYRAKARGRDRVEVEPAPTA